MKLHSHKMFCVSHKHPDGNGSILVLPTENPYPEVLCWATHRLPDGRSISIGRDATGVVALHIPSTEETSL